MTQPLSRSTVVLISFFALAVLVGGGWLYVRYDKQQSTRKSNVGVLNEGAQALNNGDYQTAIAKFQEGMNLANTPDERGYFETLLASSYENTDFQKAADMYLAVINNVSYSARTRGLAGAYLMKGLEAYHNVEYGSYVFSKAPFEGYMNETLPNKIFALETGIAKGNEWSVSVYPNFLSHLSLANFYARYYLNPHLPEKSKAFFYPRIAAYAQLGQQELAEAAKDPQWNTGLIAYGYSSQAITLQQVYELLQTGKYQDARISLDSAAVEGYFTQAIAHADQHGQDSVSIRNLRIYDRLYYAQFLLSLPGAKHQDTLTKLAGEIHDIISPAPADFSFIVGAVSGDRESTVAKRKALVSLASLNNSLKKILEDMGALSPSDFK